MLTDVDRVHYLTIESPLVVMANGRTASRSPEDVLDDWPPIRQLMGLEVEAAHADDIGGLDVTFEGGARLRVEPDPDYESWNVAGPHNALVVSVPGGGLAVWEPEVSDDDRADVPPAD